MNTIFSGFNIDEEESKKIQWYAIWSVGRYGVTNPNNWFVWHAVNNGDIFSTSLVYHEYFELLELRKLKCNPFSLDSFSLKRQAKKEGFEDINNYLEYLNSLGPCVINQRIAQASHDYEYGEVHDKALVEELMFLQQKANDMSYGVMLGALARAHPLSNRGFQFIGRDLRDAKSESGIDTKKYVVEPTESERIVAEQFWGMVNDDTSYNIFSKIYRKNFSHVVKPVIENVYSYLKRNKTWEKETVG